MYCVVFLWLFPNETQILRDGWRKTSGTSFWEIKAFANQQGSCHWTTWKTQILRPISHMHTCRQSVMSRLYARENGCVVWELSSWKKQWVCKNLKRLVLNGTVCWGSGGGLTFSQWKWSQAVQDDSMSHLFKSAFFKHAADKLLKMLSCAQQESTSATCKQLRNIQTNLYLDFAHLLLAHCMTKAVNNWNTNMLFSFLGTTLSCWMRWVLLGEEHRR